MNDVITDEELRQLVEGGSVNQGLQRQYDLQRKQAEAMRGMAPSGKMVDGHFVAPHFLQYAGEMAKNISSEKLGQRAQETGGRLDTSMGAQNATILRALLRNRGMNQPAQPMAPAQVSSAGMPAVAPPVTKQYNPYTDAGY